MKQYGRLLIPLKDGVALIGMDAHYWPVAKSTGHRAFVAFAKELKPKVVGINGDVLDASTISRHPPIGWENFPSIADEIDVARDRLYEIKDAAPKRARKFWTLGNHDMRFNTRLATVAPEYKNVKGFRLKDHFASWETAWTVELGGKHGAIIKHRFKGGQNAAKNNALWSGRTVITGHLHRLGMQAVSDYGVTRWGVEGGMLGEPNHQAFKGYTEDNPLDWQAGFVVLTFRKGQLMMPELVHVRAQGVVEWRGSLITV